MSQCCGTGVGTRFALVVSVLATGLGSCADEPDPRVDGELSLVAPWRMTEQRSGVEERLQAISVVSSEVAWASGLGGRFVLTGDGGATWRGGVVAGAEELQFRDLHAHRSGPVHLLAAGPGSDSRVYRSDDAGVTWDLQWQNPEAAGFYDCFDFWDGDTGLLYGDSITGELRVLRTSDGGATWARLESLPPAVGGEGGFAASGTCVLVQEGGWAWIGTGAGTQARVLRSEDYGDSWTARVVPLVFGGSAGVFSLVGGAGDWLMALGGDLEEPSGREGRVAVSSDRGLSWQPGGSPTFPGPIYGGARVPGLAGPTVVAVGPGGICLSRDGGASWEAVSDRESWSVAFSTALSGWAVGPGGSVLRLAFPGDE